jgi:hypothetical protein
MHGLLSASVPQLLVLACWMVSKHVIDEATASLPLLDFVAVKYIGTHLELSRASQTCWKNSLCYVHLHQNLFAGSPPLSVPHRLGLRTSGHPLVVLENITRSRSTPGTHNRSKSFRTTTTTRYSGRTSRCPEPSSSDSAQVNQLVFREVE